MNAPIAPEVVSEAVSETVSPLKTETAAAGGFWARTRGFFAQLLGGQARAAAGAGAAFDAPGAFVVTIDENGWVLAAPSLWRARFALASPSRQDGAPPAATVGNLIDVFLPEERTKIAAAARASTTSCVAARARKPDGSLGLFDLHCAPRGGKTDVLIVDMSDAAADRRTAQLAAERARADAKSSAAALADLSHEMKTPLNAVIGFADAMDAETFGPLGHAKYKEYAEDIRASGRHLLDLVVSILDMARLDAERLELSPVLAKPGVLARECAAMVRQTAEQAGLKLVLEGADNEAERMMDPRAVRQVLVNLLSNAVKFTSDGEVRLSVTVNEDETVFEVADTGVGMSQETLDKLGPRFTAAHGAGVRGAGGAGLGLALAFRLAALHGGRLDLDSAPGEGLTARLVLPRRLEAAPRRPARASVTDVATEPVMDALADSKISSPTDDTADDAADDIAPIGPADQLTQLERIEAYRREVAEKRGRSRAA